MRRGLAFALVVLAACSQDGVDLEVSTSVIDIPTTTTSEAPVRSTTTVTVDITSTTTDTIEPVVPDVGAVAPLRIILLSDDDGGRRAKIEPSQIADRVIRANEVFAPARIGFSYDPGSDVEVVADTLLNEMKGPASPGWAQRITRAHEIAARYPGEIVVLVSGAPGLEEVGSPYLDFVLVSDAESICDSTDPTALAHRLGLFLGLPHTFTSLFASSGEAADALSDALQDPAVFDGDSFDDTLPDPGVYTEDQCEPLDTVRIGGVQFELPRDNLMSHFPERADISLSQADRARWALELRRANEMRVPANGVFDQPLEAEDLLSATAGPCGLGALQVIDDGMAHLWVGSDQLVFPSGEGCRLDFTIPVPEAGTYELYALGGRGIEYGAVEFLVDGERLRLEDLYAPLQMATGPLALGQKTLEASPLVVTVEVVGSNTLSTDSSIAIDGFAVVPVP